MLQKPLRFRQPLACRYDLLRQILQCDLGRCYQHEGLHLLFASSLQRRVHLLSPYAYQHTENSGADDPGVKPKILSTTARI
jgi:hypothetical protein